MPSELDRIKSTFQNKQIPLSLEWLESCIEWCKTENLPPNYTFDQLEAMVYEQWLDLDLKDVEICSLPRVLSTEKKFVLTGIYYVQLIQVVDISKPKLWQLQRIRNNVAKNTEIQNDFGKRVLQLTLTDGVQEVQAMEFKPIASLSINLTPGTKFKIVGPVTIRNGRAMLEPQNIEKLGGLVDGLTVKYAAENVLARALGLRENQNPNLIDENILEVTEANNDTKTNVTTVWNGSAPRNNPINQIREEIPPEYELNDEMIRELEKDFEEESEHSRPPKTYCPSPDLFEEMDIDDELLLNQHLDELEKEIVTSNQPVKPTILEDSFDNIDIDSHLDNIDEEMANLPCSTQKIRDIKVKSPELKRPLNNKKLTQSKLAFVPPSDNKRFDTKGSLPEPTRAPKINVMTIEKLKKILPNVNSGKFKIKGKFRCVVEKLVATETGTYIVIKVGDNSDDVDVELHSDIAARFAQTRPEGLAELRKAVLRKEPGAEEKVMKALRNLHSKCIGLDNVLELQVERGKKYPVVINVLDDN